jgi:hypothetical protein
MPFPFIPGGLLLALAVLGGAIVLFGLALKALDWTIDAGRGSAVVSIVLGLRDWQAPGEPSETIGRSAPWAPSALVEEPLSAVRDLERVASGGTRGRGQP